MINAIRQTAAALFVLLLLCATQVVAQDHDPVRDQKGFAHPVPYVEAPTSALSLKNAGSYGTQAVVSVLDEDFESGASGWTANGEWAIGAPTAGPSGGYNSANAAGTNLSGNYSNGSDYMLVSPTIDLTSVSSGSTVGLTFREWYEIESGYDVGEVQVSTDGGSSWTALSGGSSGSSDWRETSRDLTSYVGSEIVLGFRFDSDGSSTMNGWFIDDVTVTVEEPEPLAMSLRSINTQNFPFIYLNVAVDTFGLGYDGLTQADFTVMENGVEQTNFFDVTPPTTGGSVRRADIVFVMDNSGSMQEEQDSIEANVFEFVDALSAQGVDFALGLTRYGQSGGGEPILEDGGALTSDTSYFKNDVWQRNNVSGSDEPGYLSIKESITQFAYRPGAQRIIVVITDENPDQGGATMSETLQALSDNSGILYALTEQSLFGYFEPLTSPTGGNVYDIYSSFNDILSSIASVVSNTYVVSYRSSEPQPDGVLRNVDVQAVRGSNTASLQTTYVPGAAPRIERTQATVNYSQQAWAQGATFDIEAEITDAAAPDVQGATLYYRTTGAAAYTPVAMTLQSGNLYGATIPGSVALDPGVDYYITATDGVTTSSAPSTNPNANPFQIAILPNEAPALSHTPVATAEAGTALTIRATASDNTNSLDDVQLYVRRQGGLIYQEIPMVSQGGDAFTADIPASLVTSAGVAYFIVATDDFGVTSSSGTLDAPHIITVGGADPVPAMLGVMDVPADQGGKVRVRWAASDSASGVTRYTVWRALPADSVVERATTRFAAQSVESDTVAWEQIAEQAVVGVPEYGITASTFFDSTGADLGLHYFMVVAHTADEQVYYRSEPDTGYSVNNLVPDTPLNVHGTVTDGTVQLEWDAVQAPDLAHYRIYRGETAAMDPATTTMVGTAREASFIDVTAPSDETVFYAVEAEDVAGNRSAMSASARVVTGQEMVGDLVPVIAAVEDVPGDQGGQVTVRWRASMGDTTSRVISHYSIWRTRSAFTASSVAMASLAEVLTNAKADATMQKAAADTMAWEWLDDQRALAQPYYTYTAATTHDRVENVVEGTHQFMVVAHTPDPDVFFMSPPADGFSLDNLAPAPVQSAMATYDHDDVAVRLEWAANEEEDFGQYRVYRAATRGELSDLTTLQPAFTTAETVVLDESLPALEEVVYALVAEDVHGNISGTTFVQTAITDVAVDAAVPTDYTLSQNYPNPFHGGTTIKYGVPEASNVTVEIFNVYGQLVAQLASGNHAAGWFTVQWQAGDLASGTYVCRMRAGDRMETRMLTLLK